MDKIKKFSRTVNFLFKAIFLKIGNAGGIKLNGSLFESRCAANADFKCGKNSHIAIKRIDAAPSCHFASIAGGVLEFGNGVFFNRNCTVVARKSIKIGSQCSFGPNVCIYDHDHAFGRAEKNGETFKASDVVIGNNCWIGANSVILRGTTIGDNCVIGAGCVVKGDIPANSIVTSGRGLEIRQITNK